MVFYTREGSLKHLLTKGRNRKKKHWRNRHYVHFLPFHPINITTAVHPIPYSQGGSASSPHAEPDFYVVCSRHRDPAIPDPVHACMNSVFFIKSSPLFSLTPTYANPTRGPRAS
jgi:hypothetical protein